MADHDPVASGPTGPHDPLMEARVTRLEDDMRDVRAILSRLEPMIVRMDARLEVTLPQLATKVELADMRAEIHRDMQSMRTELRQEIVEVGTELKQEIVEVRTELKQEIVELRTELRQEIGEARTDLKQEIGEVRTELKQDIAIDRTEMSKFRTEVSEGFVGVRKDITALTVELVRRPTTATVWAIGIALFGLAITSMAAGAIYLPLLFRVLHLPVPP